ncbi:bifunctional protein GlmU [Candidatus Kinetoplastibacterium desouzaii TCC079E]|uniref:Bifunctional protein GlmU n=1 Tax=Candidatus Kinetoplastidibacterium desouzai TCC079E TaxID=1208919 RepID=M1L1E3_9PROT|nr:bifunctional UDP-N-acetylglucosamine diphosphorylase/glucosamine-1-phosphate N-acetyltransferase GlmU [Candidatus Kinetoplastibacterium desouzaii]AGF46598.1 bifunctional protein GlmU [Candidatus Kinetoplastibacterium desouzaii TCC079E]
MLNIVILAAGLGTRMKSNFPKVLHALAGRPMLAYVIDSALALRPSSITIVVGNESNQIRDFVKRYSCDVNFVVQVNQLGTGHAVKQALPNLLDSGSEKDSTLILYGDVPLVKTITMESLLEARKNGLGILTSFLDNPNGYGRIIRDHNGFIRKIVEHRDANQIELNIKEINTGIIAVPTVLLKKWIVNLNNDNKQKEYYLTDIVGMAVSEGVFVGSSRPKENWEILGVNNHVQQANLERIWQEEQAKLIMESGVTLADPKRIDIRGTLECGKDVFIDVGCIFEGVVVLGDNVRIGPYCILKDVCIARDSIVNAYSHLCDANLGNNVQIGPFSRLRDCIDIDSYSKIGNFVEIKNSNFGKLSKANHLTYIGDADIGSNVNIGAGTITCNYDGLNKFRTIIEDNAFIGSDSQLIAPVMVGKDATIAAGTTLTNDAPEGQLTLSRVRQYSIPDWTRPGSGNSKKD